MLMSAFLLFLPAVAFCQKPESLHFGAEWGLSYPVISGTHATFLTEDGYLVENKELKVNEHINALVLGSIGIDLSRRFGLYVLSGYMGVTKGERVVPVTLRGVCSLSDRLTGSSIYAEAGGGFRKGNKTTGIVRLGYIFSYGLTDRLSLNFNAGSIISFSHPDIYDKYSGRYVPKPDLGLSNSLNVGAALTVGLAF